MGYSPWNSPGQNTGVGSLSLLQVILPTQGSKPGLLHCRQILYQLNHKGSPRILEWVAYPFSSGSSQPRNRTGVSYMAGRLFTNWAMREACNQHRCLQNNDKNELPHQANFIFHCCSKERTDLFRGTIQVSHWVRRDKISTDDQIANSSHWTTIHKIRKEGKCIRPQEVEQVWEGPREVKSVKVAFYLVFTTVTLVPISLHASTYLILT